MSKIPTAEEFLAQRFAVYRNVRSDDLIDFAKLHVEAALKAASEKAHSNGTYAHPEGYLAGGDINKQSILSAYPLENIK